MAITLEKLRKLVSLDPADPLSRFALGKKLLENADPADLPEAADHLAYSNAQDPGHLASYWNRAVALVRLARAEDARRVLTAGLDRMKGVGEGMGRDLGPLMQELLTALDGGVKLKAEAGSVAAAEVVELRHRILRQWLPRSEAIFPGDDDPVSLHAAVKVSGLVVSCGSMHFVALESEPAWQLRGMATDTLFQGRGLGTRVLALMEHQAANARPTRVFWCNARVGAIAFYERHGWVVASELFDIPTAGPHRMMTKVVP